jgi:hypothetical protein
MQKHFRAQEHNSRKRAIQDKEKLKKTKIQRQNENRRLEINSRACIIRMSNLPTKSVTDTMRSKTVLNKSVEVLQSISINSQTTFTTSSG